MPPVPPLSEKPCVLDVGMKSVRYGTVQYRKASCVQVSELEGTEELRVGIGIFEKEKEKKEEEGKKKKKEEEGKEEEGKKKKEEEEEYKEKKNE